MAQENPKRILIAEPDLRDAYAAEKLFLDYGWVVTGIASTFDAALEVVKDPKEQFDAILLNRFLTKNRRSRDKDLAWAVRLERPENTAIIDFSMYSNATSPFGIIYPWGSRLAVTGSEELVLRTLKITKEQAQDEFMESIHLALGIPHPIRS